MRIILIQSNAVKGVVNKANPVSVGGHGMQRPGYKCPFQLGIKFGGPKFETSCHWGS